MTKSKKNLIVTQRSTENHGDPQRFDFLTLCASVTSLFSSVLVLIFVFYRPKCVNII